MKEQTFFLFTNKMPLLDRFLIFYLNEYGIKSVIWLFSCNMSKELTKGDSEAADVIFKHLGIDEITKTQLIVHHVLPGENHQLKDSDISRKGSVVDLKEEFLNDTITTTHQFFQSLTQSDAGAFYQILHHDILHQKN